MFSPGKEMAYKWVAVAGLISEQTSASGFMKAGGALLLVALLTVLGHPCYGQGGASEASEGPRKKASRNDPAPSVATGKKAKNHAAGNQNEHLAPGGKEKKAKKAGIGSPSEQLAPMIDEGEKTPESEAGEQNQLPYQKAKKESLD